MYRKDLIWLYSFGVLMLLLTGYLSWGYVQPEWKDYQDEFRDLVAEKFGAQKAAQDPRGLQQMWVKDLDRVDRCTTCHQGMEWKGLESAAASISNPTPRKSFRSTPLRGSVVHPVTVGRDMQPSEVGPRHGGALGRAAAGQGSE